MAEDLPIFWIRHPAFPLLFRLCLQYQAPTAYEDDFLWHDANILRALPKSSPFIWVLRNMGTHLYWGDIRNSSLSIFERCFVGEVHCFAVWNGKTVQTFATPQEATAAYRQICRQEVPA